MHTPAGNGSPRTVHDIMCADEFYDLPGRDEFSDLPGRRAYCSASAAERRGRANARQLVQPIHLDFEKPDSSKILKNKMALRRIRTPYLPHGFEANEPHVLR